MFAAVGDSAIRQGAIKQIKVEVHQVTVGMFISRLDRPWDLTPFPIQGFYIRDAEEIKQLKMHCKFVFIDVVKGIAPVIIKLKTSSSAKSNASASRRMTKRQQVSASLAPLDIRHNIYIPAVTSLKIELVKAKQLHLKVFSAVTEIMLSLENSGDISVQGTKRVASEMVDSILRNPDAFSWLSQVREHDAHTYSHAVRSAVLAILFGRQIGLGKQDLNVLAMGVLLKDVGKVKIDSALLLLSERNAAEEADYEKFVELGIEMLRASGDVGTRVIGVVESHCERLNGTGFPQQLAGDKIPLLAKIAGIVTFYDEVTNPRGAAQPVAPSKAVSQLYELRNIAFQEELCVEFIRSIGLYPTGTLVELNTGEVGVVVEQNFKRRLKPKVIVVLNACKDHISSPFVVDLELDDQYKQALIDAGKVSFSEAEKIEICQSLEPGSFDIDIAKIRDDYLFSKKRKGIFSFFKR
jgi:HD-GYP domain-containing protein (c-di-GMP phosphodiesterase class II)